VKLSLSTGSLYIYPLRTTFRLAREAGFDGVELVVGPEVLWRGGAEVRRLADDYSLTIFSLHPPLFHLPGWGDYRVATRKLIALAKELNSSLIVLHPPNADEWKHPYSRAFLDALDMGQRVLAGTTIRLALENPAPPPRRGRLLTNPEALLNFAQAHDLPLVLDTAHAGSLPYTLGQAYEFCDGRLANVHFSDVAGSFPLPDILGLHTYFKRHQFPGEGRLPLADLLRRLAADGYQGPVTLELSPVALRIWWPPTVRRRLRQVVAWLQEMLESPHGQLTSFLDHDTIGM